jgi:hypothetical protein
MTKIPAITANTAGQAFLGRTAVAVAVLKISLPVVERRTIHAQLHPETEADAGRNATTTFQRPFRRVGRFPGTALADPPAPALPPGDDRA